jgi:flagellar export protein FliJ
MKPKPFTLDRLLDLRRRRQAQGRRLLADAARLVQVQEDRVQALVNRQVDARDDLRAGQAGPILDVHSIRRYRAFLAHLGREAGEAAAQLPPLRQVLDQRRAELIETRRAVRVLENLRERQTAAVTRWRRLREQKTLDDLANRQALVRRQTGRKDGER